MTLTAKQNRFVILCGSGHTQTDAYRSSYDVPPDCKEPWIWNEAYVLAHHPEVAMRIDEVKEATRAEMLAEGRFTREEALKQAQEDRQLAHREKQAGAAVAATKLSSQIAGHLTDTKEESGALLALAQLIEQVRAHGGDMLRGSLTLEKDGSGDGYTVVTNPNLLETKDE